MINMNQNFGVELNVSVVGNGETLECGLHYTDSDGMNISCDAQGDNIEDLVSELFSAFLTEYLTESAPKEEPVEEKVDDNTLASLYNRIEKLEADNRKLMETNQQFMKLFQPVRGSRGDFFF